MILIDNVMIFSKDRTKHLVSDIFEDMVINERCSVLKWRIRKVNRTYISSKLEQNSDKNQ